MDIFIRRLPQGTTRRNIQEFVLPTLKPRWRLFGSRPAATLSKIAILKIHDAHADTVEFHGLIRIEPATEAKAVIRRLNGSLLKSKRMEVRKYYRRSAARDRRRGNDEIPADISDQRKRDRRRHSLHSEMLFTGGAGLQGHLSVAV